MKLVGVLIWYDESPSWLATAVAGFGRVCDEIVAVDGAYALYPGARPRSHPEQAEAILAAAETMGIGVTIHRPKDVFWGNEVEKRNLSLKLAAPLLDEGDWVIIFDADYQLMLCEDPPMVRAILENTDKNVCTYTLFDAHDILADDVAAEVMREVDIDTEWTFRDRGILRWTPDLRYGPSHYFIQGTYDGQAEWLRGPDLISGGPEFPPADCEHLGRHLVVVHRNAKRAKVRRDAAAGYYRLRDESGVEKVDRETVHAA